VDENPGEVKEMRKLIEATLKERKIDLTGNSVGQVALDTTGDIGKAFGVESIPMIVLLDGKGVVQKVHVGFSDNTIEEVREEINTLLDGKSLAKPRAKAKEKK